MFRHIGLEGRQIKTHLLPVILCGVTKCMIFFLNSRERVSCL